MAVDWKFRIQEGTHALSRICTSSSKVHCSVFLKTISTSLEKAVVVMHKLLYDGFYCQMHIKSKLQYPYGTPSDLFNYIYLHLFNAAIRKPRGQVWCLHQASKSNSASCDLDLWPEDPQSWPFHAFPLRTTYAICIKTGSLVFKTSRSQAWRRTDGRTNRLVQSIMSPTSLDWWKLKNITK